MKKINFILPSIDKSGGVLVIIKYADLLRERGWDTRIYVPIVEYDLHRSSWVKNRLRQVRRTISNLNTSRKHEFDSNIEFVYQIKDHYIRDADVTIATAWPTAFSVSKLSPTKGEKVYFIQDYEVWDNASFGKKSYKLPLEHITIAKWIDNKLVNNLGCNPSYIVHNGMDTNFFVPEFRKANQDEITCLMLYHPLPKKGVEDGLEAFKIAKKANPKLRLSMFGMSSDPKLNAVDKYYQNPSRSTLLKLYQNSDIFIYPSREEGWGLTPVEAMSCGCAVVGTNVGCMTEIGINGKNSLLSMPYDVKALSENIKNVSSDQKLRLDLSINGRQTAVKLSWDKSADKLEEVLLRIIKYRKCTKPL